MPLQYGKYNTCKCFQVLYQNFLIITITNHSKDITSESINLFNLEKF